MPKSNSIDLSSPSKSVASPTSLASYVSPAPKKARSEIDDTGGDAQSSDMDSLASADGDTDDDEQIEDEKEHFILSKQLMGVYWSNSHYKAHFKKKKKPKKLKPSSWMECPVS